MKNHSVSSDFSVIFISSLSDVKHHTNDGFAALSSQQLTLYHFLTLVKKFFCNLVHENVSKSSKIKIETSDRL
jgi:hypothetical protein